MLETRPLMVGGPAIHGWTRRSEIILSDSLSHSSK